MIAIPAIIAAVSGIAKTVVGYNAKMSESSALLGQVQQEKDAAQQREIERRRDLMRSLATQNARAGAAGVETSGSIQGLALTDIKQNQQDLLVDTANTDLRTKDLRQRAANMRRAGVWGAVSSLMETGTGVAGSFAGGGGGAGAGAAAGGGGGFGAGTGGIYGGQGAKL